MTKPADYEDIFPRPLSGEVVETLPSALVPARMPLVGSDVTLELLDAGQPAAELYEASHGTEKGLAIWDYLTYGRGRILKPLRLFYEDNLPAWTLYFLRSGQTRQDERLVRPVFGYQCSKRRH